MTFTFTEVMTGAHSSSGWVGPAPRLQDANEFGSYADMKQVLDFSYVGVVFDAGVFSLPTIDVNVQWSCPTGLSYISLMLFENDGTAAGGDFFGILELVQDVPPDEWFTHTFNFVAGTDYNQAAVEACAAAGTLGVFGYAEPGGTFTSDTSVYYSQIAVVEPGGEPEEPEPEPASFDRCHVHLPITRENGDLFSFATVTLRDGSGTEVSPAVYDGPQDGAVALSWPVTFAPASIDLWLDEPGRFDMHIVGPSGYSAVIPGVDFLPPPGEQVIVVTPLPRVGSVTAPGRWMIQDGENLRWKDPGLIGPHEHDGAGANSTLLESVDSQSDRTLLGKDAASSGAGGTVVGAASTATATNGTVVGPSSSAPADAVTLGDHRGSGQPSDSVYLPYGSGGESNGLIDADSVILRTLSSETGADTLGETFPVPGVLPAGVTRPIWVLADAATAGLDVRGDALIGEAANLVGFYGAEPVPQPARPAGATGVLADLLDALGAYGLIGP